MYRRSLLSALPVTALAAASRPAAAAGTQPITIGIMGGRLMAPLCVSRLI